MIATDNNTHRYESQFEEADESSQFERFTYRQRGEFPVRSQAARTRAKMRGRATSAFRQKSRAFNGSNRRGRGKQWATVG